MGPFFKLFACFFLLHVTAGSAFAGICDRGLEALGVIAGDQNAFLELPDSERNKFYLEFLRTLGPYDYYRVSQIPAVRGNRQVVAEAQAILAEPRNYSPNADARKSFLETLAGMSQDEARLNVAYAAFPGPRFDKPKLILRDLILPKAAEADESARVESITALLSQAAGRHYFWLPFSTNKEKWELAAYALRYMPWGSDRDRVIRIFLESRAFQRTDVPFEVKKRVVESYLASFEGWEGSSSVEVAKDLVRALGESGGELATLGKELEQRYTR